MTMRRLMAAATAEGMSSSTRPRPSAHTHVKYSVTAQQQVHPIDQQRDPVGYEAGQQHGGERRHGNREHEEDVHPRKAAVRTAQMVQLRLPQPRPLSRA